MKKTRTLILLALIIASLFVASCKQDVSDGVTCMVNGFVYDVETGLPIEGATVSIGTKKGVTDETGYFVVSGVVSGTYDVGIVAGGYLPGTVDELIVNPGFFREVREADLVYYQSEIAANGAGSQSSISTSGVYQITQNGNTVTIRNNDAADPNTIDSIGDATRYSQTIMAVALRPANGTLTGSVVGASVYNEEDPEFLPIYDIPAGTGIVAYYLPVSFIEDDEHPEDESALLAMIKNMETTNDVVSFRTTVAADGSFTFTNVPNGLFLIVIDSFKVQGEILPIEVPQTICMREKYDEVLSGFYGRVFTAVASGHGEAGTLMAIVEKVEDTDLELLAIRAVDRSELPIEAARDINMPTGGGLVLYFSKILDTHYEDMFFGFESSHDDGVTWEVIPGTQYYIDNDYDLGLSAVYVWNDSFSMYQTTELNDYLSRIHFKVSSYDETLDDTHGVKNVYHMDIVSTNLYGESYYGIIQDGQFDPDNNILIRFDQIVPEGAFADIEFFYIKDEARKDVLFDWSIDGDVLLIDPLLLDYNQEYFLSFKIISDEGVNLYSTILGLKDAEARGIVKRDGMLNDCIVFKTAEHQQFEIAKLDDKYITNNLKIDLAAHDQDTWTYDGETFDFDIYKDISFMLTSPTNKYLISAKLTWIAPNATEVEIPVEVDVNEFDIVTISLADDCKLFPVGQIYNLKVTAYDEELQKIVIRNFINPMPVDPEAYVLIDAPNGLYSFDIANPMPDDPEHPELFDSKDENVEFKWDSEGYNFGAELAYYLLKLDENQKVVEVLNVYNEKSKIIYLYDKENDYLENAIIVGTNIGDDDLDELAFNGKTGFVLLTYDASGLLIQSPIIWVEDEVAPTLDGIGDDPAHPLLPAGDYHEDDTVTFYLKAESNELLEFESDLATWTGIEMDNVFVDSEVEYSVGLFGETRVKITVKFLSDVTLDDGADLTIEIAAEDTSGNLSEVFTVVPEVPENP